MQPSSLSTFQPSRSAKEAIPYSSAALRQDLERLRGIWEDCQATRDRNAIYGYLNAVYALVAWWTAEGREIDRARRALSIDGRCIMLRATGYMGQRDREQGLLGEQVMVIETKEVLEFAAYSFCP